MIIKKISTLITCILLPSSYGGDYYLVKEGDSLSQIIHKETPPTAPLYGENGRIKKILLLNPNIKDPNFIYVNDVIILKKEDKPKAPTKYLITNHKQEDDPTQASDPGENQTYNPSLPEIWRISADYGIKYLSYKQSGILGKVKLGSNIFNITNLKASYHLGDLSSHFQFNTYKIKYEQTGSSSSQRINSFKILGGYQNFTAGFSISENPIFKNDAGNILLSKLTDFILTLGYSKLWSIPFSEKLDLVWDSSLSYRLSAKSKNSNITISDTEGYSARTSLKISKEILNRKKYSLHLFLPAYVSYKDFQTDLTWGTSSGNTESKLWDLGTQIGAEIRF